MTTKHVNFALLGLLCIISSGCSTDTYRHWADADVQKMLHESKQQTLGYQPVTVIDDPSPKMPAPGTALAEIPQTPIVPPQPPAIEPQRGNVPQAR